MQDGFSINNIRITNKDVEIVYTPSLYVKGYTYKINNDGIVVESVYVNGSTPSNIVLKNTGIYKIEVTEDFYNGTSNTKISGEYRIDKELPIIKLKNKTFKITTKENFDIKNNISATDNISGNITNKINSNIESIDFSKEGIKKIEYSVSDEAGNIFSEIVYVTVYKDNTNLIRLGQFSIVLLFMIIVLFLTKYIKSIRHEKRFSKFTINSSLNKSISLFDNLSIKYNSILDKLSLLLLKSVFIQKRSKRYNKYIDNISSSSSEIRIMAQKILIGILYLAVTIVVKLIKSNIMQPYEMLIPFFIGFYTLDIIYLYGYNSYRKKIENDMLEAITIMNNAFKSGRSIIQAVDLVSNELSGPISKEFKKISMELSFGLDIEIAFKRFADRIKIPEAVYLTSSLSVLNKTGGNIIKVFDSIEKTLFEKKKLQVELKSLTGNSKMITYVLILIPIVFVIFISVINNEYFAPLLLNPLGYMLIAIMLIVYFTYILVVKKIMNVRM